MCGIFITSSHLRVAGLPTEGGVKSVSLLKDVSFQQKLSFTVMNESPADFVYNTRVAQSSP